ncbi:MAG: IMP cyclohydrolase [Oscillospiraceae bacterium]|nr:IMP cyclohydrolase [Oscillospiraceae bacterium]
MGLTPDGGNAVIVYFIMGRSENSRNRIFVEDGVNLRTQAFDESKVSDPSLIIYRPVRADGNRMIVTNGVQTDGIAKLMDKKHLTFEQALQFIEFEPDPPIYTPRISAIMDLVHFNYRLSIAKTADGNPDSCSRFAYSYSSPVAGQGHFIHTYGNDDKNLPSFCGEPVAVEIDNDNIDAFTEKLWHSLNADNKVSLFTRYIDLNNGNFESRVVNKLGDKPL